MISTIIFYNYSILHDLQAQKIHQSMNKGQDVPGSVPVSRQGTERDRV